MTSEDDRIQWWRWPLMPVASVIGAFLGSTIITYLQWIGMRFQGGYREDGWYYIYVMPLFTLGVFGFLLAWIACYVAPRGRLIAGVVMTTLLGVFLLIGTILAWLFPDYPTGKAIQYTLGSVAAMVGAVAALCHVHNEGI